MRTNKNQLVVTKNILFISVTLIMQLVFCYGIHSNAIMRDGKLEPDSLKSFVQIRMRDSNSTISDSNSTKSENNSTKSENNSTKSENNSNNSDNSTSTQSKDDKDKEESIKKAKEKADQLEKAASELKEGLKASDEEIQGLKQKVESQQGIYNEISNVSERVDELSNQVNVTQMMNKQINSSLNNLREEYQDLEYKVVAGSIETDRKINSIDKKLSQQLQNQLNMQQFNLQNEIAQLQEQVKKLDTRINQINEILPGTNNECGLLASCGACTANPACGWCSLSQQCVPGDANGASDGSCTLFDYGTCSGPKDCETYSDCGDCIKDASCGWCNNIGNPVCMNKDDAEKGNCAEDRFYLLSSKLNICPHNNLNNVKAKVIQNLDKNILKDMNNTSGNPLDMDPAEKKNLINELSILTEEKEEKTKQMSDLVEAVTKCQNQIARLANETARSNQTQVEINKAVFDDVVRNVFNMTKDYIDSMRVEKTNQPVDQINAARMNNNTNVTSVSVPGVAIDANSTLNSTQIPEVTSNSNETLIKNATIESIRNETSNNNTESNKTESNKTEELKIEDISTNSTSSDETHKNDTLTIEPSSNNTNTSNETVNLPSDAHNETQIETENTNTNTTAEMNKVNETDVIPSNETDSSSTNTIIPSEVSNNTSKINETEIPENSNSNSTIETKESASSINPEEKNATNPSNDNSTNSNNTDSAANATVTDNKEAQQKEDQGSTTNSTVNSSSNTTSNETTQSDKNETNQLVQISADFGVEVTTFTTNSFVQIGDKSTRNLRAQAIII